MNDIEKIQKQAEILKDISVIVNKQAENMLKSAKIIEKNSIEGYNKIAKILGNEKR